MINPQILAAIAIIGFIIASFTFFGISPPAAIVQTSAFDRDYGTAALPIGTGACQRLLGTTTGSAPNRWSVGTPLQNGATITGYCRNAGSGPGIPNGDTTLASFGHTYSTQGSICYEWESVEKNELSSQGNQGTNCEMQCQPGHFDQPFCVCPAGKQYTLSPDGKTATCATPTLVIPQPEPVAPPASPITAEPISSFPVIPDTGITGGATDGLRIPLLSDLIDGILNLLRGITGR